MIGLLNNIFVRFIDIKIYMVKVKRAGNILVTGNRLGKVKKQGSKYERVVSPFFNKWEETATTRKQLSTFWGIR